VSSEPQSLRIEERFVSLQGEGLLAGVPSTFVRISGCNLRCAWCDSPRSSWHPQGDRQSLDELLEFCAAGPRHVVITGGEPLLFAATAQLSRTLAERGHHVTIETAATVELEGVHADLFSLSPKLAHSSPSTPGWRERHDARRRRPAVIRALMRWPWQLKLVVRAYDASALADDLEEVETLLRELELDPRDRDRVLLMPECTDPARLSSDYAALVPVCRAHGFRLGPRLHIAIFGHTPGT
jgi:7-carboxy-7-deazaguanine synthase